VYDVISSKPLGTTTLAAGSGAGSEETLGSGAAGGSVSGFPRSAGGAA